MNPSNSHEYLADTPKNSIQSGKSRPWHINIFNEFHISKEPANKATINRHG